MQVMADDGQIDRAYLMTSGWRPVGSDWIGPNDRYNNPLSTEDACRHQMQEHMVALVYLCQRAKGHDRTVLVQVFFQLALEGLKELATDEGMLADVTKGMTEYAQTADGKTATAQLRTVLRQLLGIE